MDDKNRDLPLNQKGQTLQPWNFPTNSSYGN